MLLKSLGENIVSQAKKASQASVYVFIAILCFICAAGLAIISSSLSETQEKAVVFDQSKQMLMAAKIIHPEGHFVLPIENDWKHLQPAKYDQKLQKLMPSTEKEPALSADVFTLYQTRLVPMLCDNTGSLQSFQQAGIDSKRYLEENQSKGFAHLPLKLIYEIKGNGSQETTGYIVPVSGFGLWGAIYGYVAIMADGLHILGISWYKHVETPGLGANISEPWWQEQFTGKQIFQAPNPGESLDPTIAPIGISVVRGKVVDLYGEGPKSKNSVDGMSGATLTGTGVSKAYKDTLEAYRPFFKKLIEKSKK